MLDFRFKIWTEYKPHGLDYAMFLSFLNSLKHLSRFEGIVWTSTSGSERSVTLANTLSKIGQYQGYLVSNDNIQ